MKILPGQAEGAPALTSPSVLFLIVVNLVPLFGAVFLGWDVGVIMLLYWLETVVIGLFNVPKIMTARQPMSNGPSQTPQQAGGCGLLFIAVFFMVHYGMFNFGHYSFLKDMFDFPDLRDFTYRDILDRGIGIALIGLAISHLFSLAYNWFGKREFETVSPSTQMFTPYGRVMVMHVVIILGGFAALFAGGGVIVLALLVIGKTAMDVLSHRWGHSFRQHMQRAAETTSS